jgi:hypothetical protein
LAKSTKPQNYARRILGLTDVKEASRILREISIAILNDIKGLPEQVTDPDCLERLEKADQ